jgi:hypothetical protein
MDLPTDIRNTTKSSRSVEHIDTALVILTAGRKDKRRFEDFQLMLSSFSKLSVAPDIAFLFQDWGADSSYAKAISNRELNLSFPVRVVSRPNDTVVLYPVHYYKGHLKLLWWWTMNTAFAVTYPKQVCYFEDDLAIHPDFFAWVKQVRRIIPRQDYWGLFGAGNLQYTPLCVDRYEWSLLLYYYHDFCFKEQGAWDMTLFGLHQNGPLPKMRAQTSTEVAIHLPYSKGSTTDKITEMNRFFSANLSLTAFQLRTPYYPGAEEPSKLADLNFETFTKEGNRASTQTQLLKMIDFCVDVAKDTRAKLQIDERLIPIHIYNETKGTDVQGYTLASFQDNDLYLNQSRTICNMNADCMGFVHVDGKTHFKSNVSSELRRNTGNVRMSLFTKKCKRVSARNLCIPAFEYIDW